MAAMEVLSRPGEEIRTECRESTEVHIKENCEDVVGSGDQMKTNCCQNFLIWLAALRQKAQDAIGVAGLRYILRLKASTFRR